MFANNQDVQLIRDLTEAIYRANRKVLSIQDCMQLLPKDMDKVDSLDDMISILRAAINSIHRNME